MSIISSNSTPPSFGELNLKELKCLKLDFGGDPKQGYDLEGSSMVATEYGVDSALILKNPVDPFIMIKSNFITLSDESWIKIYAKPISVYHQYLEFKESQTPGRQTINCFRGTVPDYTNMEQTVAECDKKSDIKTKFEYTGPIPIQEKITRPVDLDVGTFAIFQTVLVYGIKLILLNGSAIYYTASVYRDQVFGIPTSRVWYEPPSAEQARAYLMGSVLVVGVVSKQSMEAKSNQMNVTHSIKEYVDKMLGMVDGMKVLVLDKETAGIVSMVYTQSDILQKQVFLFERIDNESAEIMTHLKAVYFVRPTQLNISKIVQELSCTTPKYSSYNLFFSNIIGIGLIDELAKSDNNNLVHQVQEFFADFYAINQDLFNLNIDNVLIKSKWSPQQTERIIQGVFSSLLAVKRKPSLPTIRYSIKSESSKFLASSLNDKILKERDLFSNNTSSSTLLLILDRKDDPVTPLLHQWTYQAMVHELMGIHNNVVKLEKPLPNYSKDKKKAFQSTNQVILSSLQDSFFRDNLYQNYGDLGSIIKKLVDSYQEKTNSNANISTIEDMKNFMLDYPDFLTLSSKVSKHVAVMEELSNRISKDFLMDISEMQQELACNHEHNTAYVTLVQALENPKYNAQDKLVLVLLYSLRYEDGRLWELKELLEKRVGIPKEDISLITTLINYASATKREGDLFGNKNLFTFVRQMATRGLNGVSNIYTQHKPLLFNILNQIQNDKLSIQSFPFISQTTKEKPTEIIIFMVGGITFEEAYNVFSFNLINKGGPKIVLGGTSIINCKQFLNELRGLGKS
ncbi:hypothetical protein DFA_10074 [Cavenderia fasciculata]|uniref:Monalysin Pore-forming domain-containing protein n=1 Tax=Cavenderia fasciculata TaxID=261658 RepID=F4Q972_CACFS|nr:uncharacterized protein DFA_10074 [Cavenderia fasciculata]EGG15241.1 hypothetical protein DFA_10074 [Cavenderia fasciculata]|eukprot:XP_004351961.1 hypothetical protein DFA_10074 [Cavenderia fasciculata]